MPAGRLVDRLGVQGMIFAGLGVMALGAFTLPALSAHLGLPGYVGAPAARRPPPCRAVLSMAVGTVGVMAHGKGATWATRTIAAAPRLAPGGIEHPGRAGVDEIAGKGRRLTAQRAGAGMHCKSSSARFRFGIPTGFPSRVIAVTHSRRNAGSGALRDGALTLPSNRGSGSKRISSACKARYASAWRLAGRARGALRPAWAKSTSREGAPSSQCTA